MSVLTQNSSPSRVALSDVLVHGKRREDFLGLEQPGSLQGMTLRAYREGQPVDEGMFVEHNLLFGAVGSEIMPCTSL